MSRAVWILLLGVVAAGATAGFFVRGGHPGEATSIMQPIVFSHRTHVRDEELECADCHAEATRSAHAGFPGRGDCLDCHSEPEGDDPEEAKVRALSRGGAEIAWVPVNRNVGHVYFSHRAHTGPGEMSCEDCHAGIEDLDEPPHPDPLLHSMNACRDCHRERQASLECVACHQ